MQFPDLHHPARNDRVAAGYAVLAVALWSTVAAAFKLTLRYLDVFQLLLIASVTATLCLYAILAFRGRAAEPWVQSHSAYRHALLLGVLNPFGYYLVLFRAYSLLPAQIAQPLNYTWVITLMLLSVPLLKHRLQRFDLAGALICYLGVVVVCMGGSSVAAGELSGPGIALALGSTVIWALYWIAKTRDTLDPVTTLFLSFLFSLPFVFTACVLFSDLRSLPPYGIAGGIYVGLFEMGITYVFWLLALRYSSSAAKVGTLIFLSPFLSLILIHYLLGERVAATSFLGLLLIVSGLLVQQQFRSADPASA